MRKILTLVAVALVLVSFVTLMVPMAAARGQTACMISTSESACLVAMVAHGAHASARLNLTKLRSVSNGDVINANKQTLGDSTQREMEGYVPIRFPLLA
jgi:hypothetical protein